MEENIQKPMDDQQQPEQQNTQPEKNQEPAKDQEGDTPEANAKNVEDDKAVTYLAYLGLLFLVPLFAKKDSKFAQFHAKQGLVLTIGWFVGGFLYVVFGLGALVHLAIIVLSIMGLVNVSKGEMKDLPLVGDLAKKFNF